MKVKFAPLKRQGDEFVLTLSRKMTYDQFAKKVGEHLGTDYSHLRFCPVLATNGKPKQPIKRTINQTLFQILNGQYGSYGYSMHLPDALYYEVLDTSLSEYETKKTLKVTWLIDGINKEVRLLWIYCAIAYRLTWILRRRPMSCLYPEPALSATY